uniref:Uncharacterized protein n=1 Tax=Caenorhabditis japonica TaxID=281687 RepID=A0A8R1IBH6_CAEJA
MCDALGDEVAILRRSQFGAKCLGREKSFIIFLKLKTPSICEGFPPISSNATLNRRTVANPCALYSEIAKKNPKVAAVSRRLALATDLMTINHKSSTAVIENLVDSKEGSQGSCDKLFITKFCSDSSLPIHTEVFRVPRKNESSNPCPTKVRFSSQSDRDAFLRGFITSWSGYTHRKIGARPVRARRDMTREELDVLYAIRKEVYEANSKAGMIKYAVHDLNIVQLKSPRALPTASPPSSALENSSKSCA